MKPVFNIGRARHRILLQQLQTSSDSAGGTSGTWVDLLSGATEGDRQIFAVVEPMQGRRGLEYKQTVNYYPFSVVIRLNRSLSYTAKYRFLLDGKVYVIHSIINKNDRDFTYELLAYTLEQDGESALPTCADATAVLNNTLGTELSSTPIASGATSIIVAPDATAVVKDTGGTILATANIASGVSQDIVIDGGGGVSVLYAYNFQSLNSGTTVEYVAGDDKWARDNVFNPEIATWPSAIAVNRVYPSLNVNDSSLLEFGVNPDGSGNNIYGNKQRYTDENGLQVFGNDYFLDHLTGLAYTFLSSVTFDTYAADSLTHSLLSFTDWFTLNIKGIYSILQMTPDASNSSLAFTPFNKTGLIWCGTTVYNSSTRAYYLGSRRNILDTGKTAAIDGIICRKAFAYNAVTGEMELT